MNNRLSYNPDVLSCLANLSNDEVFTPPQLANQMLDMLPQELFQSPDTKFLDPCTKSGVFLREIAKRLIEGLAETIPDLQRLIDHIMHHQLYGVAITQLTSMMSRRSLYCSKSASGKYSISQFDDEAGNILVSNAAFPGSWGADATIKVINPETGETKEYTVPQECGLLGRCDFIGFAKGDFFDEYNRRNSIASYTIISSFR